MEFLSKFKSILLSEQESEQEQNIVNPTEQEEDDQEKPKESFIATVVDLANFLDRDLANLFEKIYVTTNNANADIIAIVNIHRKELIEKIDTIANIFRKFSVLVYFATSETDIEVVKFATRKANFGIGKVLVATGDYSLIQSITTFLTPDKVGFFIDKSNVPSQIHAFSQVGYSIRVSDIISKKEGLIKRLIHIPPNFIRRARNYSLPQEIEEKILSVLPKEMNELREYIEKNNLMNNIDNFKIELASLAIRDKVKFYHDKEKNTVTVLPKRKESEEVESITTS